MSGANVAGGKKPQQTTKPETKPVVKQNCPAKNPPPCDIQDLVLTAEIADEDGNVRVLSLAGTEGVTDKQNRMEVVTFRKSDPEKTKITARIKNLVTHSQQEHPALRIYAAQADPQLWTGAKASKVQVEVCTAPWIPMRFGMPFSTLFNFQVKPVTYIFTASTCGKRNSGKVVGSGQLKVDAYPGDQYKIEYSSGYGRTYSNDYKKPEGGGKKQMVPKSTLDAPEPSISVTRNGVEFMEGGNLKELLDCISTTRMILKGLQEMIDGVPKSGVMFHIGFDMFSGSMSFEWGWRQGDGLRVYYGVAAEIALTLLSLELSLGFGLDWNLLVLKVEIGISKAELALRKNVLFKRRSDERSGNWVVKISLVIEIEAVAKVEAKVGYKWCSYKAEVGVLSGVKGAGGVKLRANGAHPFYELTWTGVKGYLKTGTPTSAEEENAKQFVEARQLGKWEAA